MRTQTLDPVHVPEPLAGAAIDVVVEGGWKLAVRRPSTVLGTEVVIAPAIGATAMPGGAMACSATLQWRTPRGVVTRTGTLVLRDASLVLVDVANPVVVQRRDHARVRCTARVVVTGDESGADLCTSTVDLSVGGMLMERADRLAVGERTRFTLGLAGDLDVRGTGRVVRATPFGHRAVCFDPLSRGDEQRLARFVMAQEREGRSAAAYA